MDNYLVEDTTLQAGYPLDMRYAGIADEDKVEIDMSGHSAK